MSEIASQQRSQYSFIMLSIMLETTILLVLDNNNAALSFQGQILAGSDKIEMASNP